MILRLSSLTLLFIIALVLASAKPATAYTPKIEPVRESYGTFNIIPEYALEDACAGVFNLQLKVTISTMGKTNLKIIACEPNNNSVLAIQPLNSDPSSIQDGVLLKTEYLYKIEIAKDAEPRRYMVTLKLQYMDKPVITRLIDLNVGVTSNGRVRVTEAASASIECTTGEMKKYRLTLHNDFRDYPVNIRRIVVSSQPGGLIESRVFDLNPPLVIRPSQRESVDLDFRVAGMSIARFINGFGKTATLNFELAYDDSNGRQISDFTHSVPLTVVPHAAFSLSSILIGVLIGTLLINYQNLKKDQLVSKATIITVTTGVVISFVAWAGGIKITAFDLQGSYDNPLMTFIIGLVVGAKGGFPFLDTLIKPKGAGTSTPGTPGASSTPPATPGTHAAASGR